MDKLEEYDTTMASDLVNLIDRLDFAKFQTTHPFEMSSITVAQWLSLFNELSEEYRDIFPAQSIRNLIASTNSQIINFKSAIKDLVTRQFSLLDRQEEKVKDYERVIEQLKKNNDKLREELDKKELHIIEKKEAIKPETVTEKPEEKKTAKAGRPSQYDVQY